MVERVPVTDGTRCQGYCQGRVVVYECVGIQIIVNDQVLFQSVHALWKRDGTEFVQTGLHGCLNGGSVDGLTVKGKGKQVNAVDRVWDNGGVEFVVGSDNGPPGIFGVDHGEPIGVAKGLQGYFQEVQVCGNLFRGLLFDLFVANKCMKGHCGGKKISLFIRLVIANDCERNR